MWTRVLTQPFVGFTIAMVFASLSVARLRPIVLLIVLPFTVLWATSFSYDRRNLALALPFIAMAAGFGTVQSLKWLRDAWSGNPRLAGVVFSVLGVLGIGLVAGPGVTVRIEAANLAQLAQRGDPGLNKALYGFAEGPGFHGKILTNYRMLDSLPELRKHYFVNRGATADRFWVFRGGAQEFSQVVGDPANEIRYVLSVQPLRPEIGAHIGEQLASGRYKLLLTARTARLFEVVGNGEAAE